ncbi:phospholipase A2 isozymes PA3A/PA3B/PA5-like [Acanthaster planci]|uniref:Phospholipase A2 isozymes PA3A/PA3B/PA5-like n=1 Tax=Acanthaster planci TaxID=133434 RepID=A0A8B7YJD3_ACAPL|nr:phospholipase A2 isozymes PA3A/PA3B/PA5-like [Acanthaster planci]
MKLLKLFTVLLTVGQAITLAVCHRQGVPDFDVNDPRESDERFVRIRRNTAQSTADGRLIRGRGKRSAFIVDGTVWCGIGDTAQSYSELGTHREADMCCRDHDHCPEKIYAFSRAFGLFNFYPYTINLCSCDESFRLCLQEANTTASVEVGQFFFDVLRPACFNLSDTLTQRCIRRSWFGFCLEYGRERTAEVGVNKPFDGVAYQQVRVGLEK